MEDEAQRLYPIATAPNVGKTTGIRHTKDLVLLEPKTVITHKPYFSGFKKPQWSKDWCATSILVVLQARQRIMSIRNTDFESISVSVKKNMTT